MVRVLLLIKPVHGQYYLIVYTIFQARRCLICVLALQVLSPGSRRVHDYQGVQNDWMHVKHDFDFIENVKQYPCNSHMCEKPLVEKHGRGPTPLKSVPCTSQNESLSFSSCILCKSQADLAGGALQLVL